ncbi:MAG: hypothetical protein Q8K78_06025, partial [Planctomycetaceae bacterium]|nr:hypothetical protein [Planctomycetaceae bacterium]
PDPTDAIKNGALREISNEARLAQVPSDLLHHRFTNSRKAWFKSKYGLDVDKFAVKVDQLTHEALYSGAGKNALGNKAGWRDRELTTRIREAEMLKGSLLNESELLEIVKKMLERFKLNHLPIVPYK